MIVRDCLGREREPSQVWPDGSYNCPFCCAAVEPNKAPCPNPGCWARGGDGMPPYPVECAREQLAAQEAAKRDAEERCQWMRERREQDAAEQNAWWAETRAECVRRGACVDCCRKRSNYYPCLSA